jgi:dolichol-phosphate mannosyltransferase
MAEPLLSVVVPTKNERGNVLEVITRLEAALPTVALEIIFVDDSTDGTAELVQEIAGNNGSAIVLLPQRRDRRTGGLGAAVVQGLRAARAPWVCVMDADLQHPPELVASLLEQAESRDLDVVVASRYCDNGDAGSFGWTRAMASRSTTTAARLLFPRRLKDVTDPMSGFFLVRREALDVDRLRPRGFKILLELLVRHPALRAAEVSFTFGERRSGQSKAGVREAVRYLSLLARLRFARFGAVGISGLVVNTAVLAFLTDFAGLFYVVSAIFATQVSTLWNFCFTELWVFSDRETKRGRGARMGLFFLMNNAALALRGPLLIVLTSGLGMHYALSNIVSLVSLTLVRFAVADSWIWAKERPPKVRVAGPYGYDIHGIVSVLSDVLLPELERFRVGALEGDPDLRVRLGRISANGNGSAPAISGNVSAPAISANGSAPAISANGSAPDISDNGSAPAISANGNGSAPTIRYREGPAGLGFGVEIKIGKPIEATASPLVGRSPHVLYTNVVEPILRWTFADRGYALVHAACLADGDQAFFVTARTDTGKTTTSLRLLDSGPYSFLSDDLTLVAPNGRVLPYPKPLTISRHTLRAVKTPLLTRRERAGLVVQSRLHSRSGRRFALILARTHLPAATINALVQLLVPPPKFHVERLVPGVTVAAEASLAGMVVIQRGGVGEVVLSDEEALETLMSNCEDAYGFPPYAAIEGSLRRPNGSDLKQVERATVASALSGRPATLLRSETMDWSQRLPGVIGAWTRTGRFTRSDPSGQHRGTVHA